MSFTASFRSSRLWYALSNTFHRYSCSSHSKINCSFILIFFAFDVFAILFTVAIQILCIPYLDRLNMKDANRKMYRIDRTSKHVLRMFHENDDENDELPLDKQ